jgi:hypothetical protein
MRRPDLAPDCGSCAALCCVATSFDASEDFAFAKPAGAACRYLTGDCRCAVHSELVARGLRGCAAYDCYGAGQRATRAFAGGCGRERECERDVGFAILRDVHELLWLLTEAAKLCAVVDGALAAELASEVAALDALAGGAIAALITADLTPRRERARGLLLRVGRVLGGRRGASSLSVVG